MIQTEVDLSRRIINMNDFIRKTNERQNLIFLEKLYKIHPSNSKKNSLVVVLFSPLFTRAANPCFLRLV